MFDKYRLTTLLIGAAMLFSLSGCGEGEVRFRDNEMILSGGSLPPKYHGDIAPFSGSTFVRGLTMRGYNLTFSTSARADDILRHYKDKLPSAGWTIETAAPGNERFTLRAVRGDKVMTVRYERERSELCVYVGPS